MENLSHQVSPTNSQDLTPNPSNEPIQPVQSQLETASQPSLEGKGILMTDIIVEDKQYLLPISTGLSYFSVCEDFAKELMSRNENIQIQPVPLRIQSTFQDAENKTLCPIGSIEVPITWNTGHHSHFQMLIFKHFPYKTVFGHNHLVGTHAIIDHANNLISFHHPDKNFQIKCRTDNPYTTDPLKVVALAFL